MAVAGHLDRAVAQLQIGHVRSMQRRERQNQEYGLQELDLQYQLPVSGRASPSPGWGAVELNFEWSFHYAPANRDSDLEVPHVTFGAYITKGAPVALHACVTDWKVEQANEGITGCTIQVAAFASSPVGRDFAGFLHANVQGYATSRDDLSDNPDMET